MIKLGLEKEKEKNNKSVPNIWDRDDFPRHFPGWDPNPFSGDRPNNDAIDSRPTLNQLRVQSTNTLNLSSTSQSSNLLNFSSTNSEFPNLVNSSSIGRRDGEILTGTRRLQLPNRGLSIQSVSQPKRESPKSESPKSESPKQVSNSNYVSPQPYPIVEKFQSFNIGKRIEKAKNGNIDAQINLGHLYWLGIHVKPSIKESLYWFKLASEQENKEAKEQVERIGKEIHEFDQVALKASRGDANAQFNLGLRYEFGIAVSLNHGVEQNIQLALQWYLTASKQGNEQAKEAHEKLKISHDESSKLLKRAEEGDIESQYSIACRYELGSGVNKDPALVFSWLKKAAGKGHIAALYKIADIYLRELDDDFNEPARKQEIIKTAISAWQICAEKGYSTAQSKLAYSYLNGNLIEKDPKLAFKWFHILASRNDGLELKPIYKHQVGCMYRDGLGVEKDIKIAEEWFNAAVQHGIDKVQQEQNQLGNSLAELITAAVKNAETERKVGGESLSYNQLVSPTDKSPAMQELLRKASMGDAEAAHELGDRYLHGFGVNQSILEALAWYKKIGTPIFNFLNFLPSSLLNVHLSRFSILIKKHNDSQILLKKAAAGNFEAQYALATQYQYGIDGVEQNIKLACEWFQKATTSCFNRAESSYRALKRTIQDSKQLLEKANAGDIESQYKMAKRYERGDGVDRDPWKAFEWYHKSAKAGHLYGQLRLAKGFSEGWIEKNEKLAQKWHTLAQNNVQLRKFGNSISELLAMKSFGISFEELYDNAIIGNNRAQYLLGIEYSKGQIVKQNIDLAIYWITRAQNQMGILEKRDQLENKEIEDLYRSICTHVGALIQASMDDHNQQSQLGIQFAHGFGCNQNVNLAKYWLEKSIENIQDTKRENEWLKFRKNYEEVDSILPKALHGEAAWQFILAEKYEKGQGVDRDPVLAFYWYEQAAMKGCSYAQLNTALNYAQGLGTVKDKSLALKWSEMAVKEGHWITAKLANLLSENPKIQHENKERREQQYEALSGVQHAQYARLKHLDYLNLNGLNLGFLEHSHIESLLQMIGRNTSLVFLDLSNNRLGLWDKKYLEQLVEVIEKNRNLIVVNVSDNNLKDSEELISEAVANNRTILLDPQLCRLWNIPYSMPESTSLEFAPVQESTNQSTPQIHSVADHPVEEQCDINTSISNGELKVLKEETNQRSKTLKPTVIFSIAPKNSDEPDAAKETQAVNLPLLPGLNQQTLQQSGNNTNNTSPTAQLHNGSEHKTTQEKTQVSALVQITEEQLKLISLLQKSGLQPDTLSQLQKQLSEFPLSPQELQRFGTWAQGFSTRVSQLETELSNTNKALARDPQTQSEQAYIDKRPKLKNYQNRLEKELCCFITCYFLAPAGIFKLEDNKKESAISAISSIPIAGQFLKVLTFSLSAANKKYRFYQMNRLNELFQNLGQITQVICAFARQITLAQENSIEQQVLVKYQGLGKIKGFFQMVKDTLDNQWKDLATSDRTGVTLGAEDKFAILDCAYLLQQILSGEAKIDRNGDLIAQFVQVITGQAYQPRVFTSATSLQSNLSNPSSTSSATPLVGTTLPITAPTTMLTLSALAKSNDNFVSLEEYKTLQEKIELSRNERDEILRKQRDEFEAHKSEQAEIIRKQKEKAEAAEQATKALAERIARTEKDTEKLKKEIHLEDLNGGSMAQAKLSPEAHGVGRAHQTETSQILANQNKQLHALTEDLTALKEKQSLTEGDIYNLQNKTGIKRGKREGKRLEQTQFRNELERKKKQEESDARTQQKQKEQQVRKNGFV